MQLFASPGADRIRVGYALPAAALRPYLSAYSLIVVEPGEPDVFDEIYPEWGNIRLSPDGDMACCPGPGELQRCNPIAGIGPTSHATRFRLAAGQYWTIGLLPLGWATFIGAPAERYAERWEFARGDSPFAPYAGLLDCVSGQSPEAAVARIDALFAARLGEPVADCAAIERVHEALVDPAVTLVSELADRAGLTIRTLERLAGEAFGFGPKLLLRRQRFLRSLAQYMLDPSLAWIATMDTQYVDQAHFIRDFRRFMDSTPRQYAKRPHPVLWAAAQARAAVAGNPMQVLQPPQRSTAREALR